MPPTDDEAVLVELASAALGARLTAPAPLGGSDRSLVLRCATDDGTVVVKRFLDGDDGWDGYVRERTGLDVLHGTPDLLAADDGHRVLVMSDLGTWPTLADVLLDGDPAAAHDAAVSWAGALGGLLGSSRPHTQHVGRALADAGAAAWDPMDAVRRGTDSLLELLRMTRPDELDADLAALTGELDPAPEACVVSPGDTCPDNAVRTPSGWRFLDVEGTTTHHVAMDAAYTALPFASCWCVFDPPPGLTDAMLDAFTAAAAPALPEVVGGPGWRASVDRACGAWLLAANAWLVPGAVAARHSVGPAGRQAPSHRALLAARWRWGAERLAATLPATAALLDHAAGWATRSWGEAVAELPTYPAFRGPRVR